MIYYIILYYSILVYDRILYYTIRQRGGPLRPTVTANLQTKLLNVGGFDSSRILSLTLVSCCPVMVDCVWHTTVHLQGVVVYAWSASALERTCLYSVAAYMCVCVCGPARIRALLFLATFSFFRVL